MKEDKGNKRLFISELITTVQLRTVVDLLGDFEHLDDIAHLFDDGSSAATPVSLKDPLVAIELNPLNSSITGKQMLDFIPFNRDSTSMAVQVPPDTVVDTSDIDISRFGGNFFLFFW
jgi:hypothetical protein